MFLAFDLSFCLCHKLSSNPRKPHMICSLPPTYLKTIKTQLSLSLRPDLGRFAKHRYSHAPIPSYPHGLFGPHFENVLSTTNITYSIVMRLGTGPCDKFGISVTYPFSSSFSIFRVAMCGFNPLLKFNVQAIAFAIVRIMRITVITANVASERLAGK